MSLRRTLLAFALLAPSSWSALSAQDAATPRYELLRADGNGVPALQRTLSVRLADVPLAEALRAVARDAGVSITVPADLEAGSTRVSLDEGSVSAARAMLRLLAGLEVELLVSPANAALVLRPLPVEPAPAGSILGTVVDADTGEPLQGVQVVVVETGTGALSAADGAFRLAGLANGTYSLRLERMGYATEEVDSLQLSAQGARVRRAMRVAPTPLAAIVVTPGLYGVSTERLAKPQSLSREQLETQPGLAEDLYRMVTRLPGVAANEMSAHFSVRGGNDDELLVTLDGVELYEPFHLKDIGGAISIVDVHAVGGAQLTAGGFGAPHGDRLTGLFDISTTSGFYQKERMSLGLSLTNARATSHGPIGSRGGFWLASARRGYLDLVLGMLDIEERMVPRYYDLLGKVVLPLGRRGSFSAHALHAGDHLIIEEPDDDGRVEGRHGSSYAWVNWKAGLGDGVDVQTVLSAGQLDWKREADERDEQNRGDAGFHLTDERDFAFLGVRQSWSWEMSERALLSLGFEAQRVGASYAYSGWVERDSIADGVRTVWRDTTSASPAPDGSRVGLYLSQRVRPWAPLTVEVGARYDRQSYTAETQVSPRINAAYSPRPWLTLRGAWGEFAQSQRIYQLHVQDGDESFYPAERAEHRGVGIEALLDGLELRVEAYDRELSRMRPRYFNMTTSSTPVGEAESDRVAVLPARGRARGVELLVAKTSSRMDWSASYALAKAEDEIGGRWVPRAVDQRHALNFVVGYRPKPNWSIGGNWQYHSGWPATSMVFRVERVGSSIWTVEGFGDLNAKRLPSYHRLDLRATRLFQVGDQRISVYVDVFNAYNRQNAGGFEYSVHVRNGQLSTQERYEALLPRIPSIGVNWEF
jgi:hypothetical protein